MNYAGSLLRSVGGSIVRRGLKRIFHGGFRSRRLFKKRRFTKAVKKAIGYNPEYKYLDNQNTVFQTPLDTNTALHYSVLTLNIIGCGTSFNNRVGRSIMGKYIEILVRMQAPTTAANSDFLRMLLVHDAQPNHVQALGPEVLDTTVTTTCSDAFKNIAKNGQRFRIVWDYTSPMLQLGQGDIPTVRLNYKIPEYLGRSTYNDDSTSIPNSGSWIFYCFSQNNSGDPVNSAGYYATTRYAFMEE